MTNSNLITTTDLTVIDEEPRIKDIVLGEALGLKKSRDIRPVIEANMPELQSFGSMPLVTAMITAGKGAKRTVQEYFLNEPQALLLCMFSRTERAAQVRRELISVYLAHRTRGMVKVKEHYRKVYPALASSISEIPAYCRKAIQGFIEECAEMNEYAMISCADAYQAFKEWFKENNQNTPLSISANAFGRILYGMGIEKGHDTGGNKAYVGISIKKPYVLHQISDKTLIGRRQTNYTDAGIYILQTEEGIRDVYRCTRPINSKAIKMCSYINEEIVKHWWEASEKDFKKHVIARVDARIERM